MDGDEVYLSSPESSVDPRLIKLDFHRRMKAYHESKQFPFGELNNGNIFYDAFLNDMFHSVAADYHGTLLGFYAYRMLRRKYSIGKIIREVRNMQQQAKKEKAAAY